METSSDRMFGSVMAGFFTIIGLFPLLSGAQPHWWAIIVAAAFLSLALLLPRSLSLLNRYWTKFGLLLGAIVSPISLGILFFGVITPYGWLMRKLGKVAIPTQFDREAESYWISREAPESTASSLKNQF